MTSTRAASRSGSSRPAGPTRRATTRSSGPWPPPPWRAVERRPRPRPAARRCPARADRAGGPRSSATPRAAWGVQRQPEVDEVVSAPGSPRPSAPSSPTAESTRPRCWRDIRGSGPSSSPAWAPLAAGFAGVALGAVGPEPDTVSRPATTKGKLTRLGFRTRAARWPPRPARRGRRPAARPPGAHRRPRPGARLLVRLVEAAGPTASELLRELADDEGTAMRLLCVLGASEALGEHLSRHPAHWRELTDPTLGSTRPAAYAVREGLLRGGRRRPAVASPVATLPDHEAVDALRVEYRRVLLRLAARDLTHHLGRRRRRRRALRPRRGHARGGAGRRPPARGRGRRAGPAGRHRDGQVRGPRAQLRLRRRRDLRARARRRRRRGPGAAGRHPARQPPDADLLRAHRRGHDLAGRRRPAAGGQERPADPHAGQPPGLLRALGQDLGVPGPAQGPRRWPATSRSGRRTSTSSSRWSGRRPSARASSPTSRPCAAGSSRTSRPTRPSGSSSSAPAGCATSSSPSSCCSWCTAAPTPGSARPPRSAPWPS